jgi:hypothetical protein
MVKKALFIVLMIMVFAQCNSTKYLYTRNKSEQMLSISDLIGTKIISMAIDTNLGIIYCRAEVWNKTESTLLVCDTDPVYFSTQSFGAETGIELVDSKPGYPFRMPKKFSLRQEVTPLYASNNGRDKSKVIQHTEAIVYGDKLEQIDSVKVKCIFNGFVFKNGQLISLNSSIVGDSLIFRLIR